MGTCSPWSDGTGGGVRRKRPAQKGCQGREWCRRSVWQMPQVKRQHTPSHTDAMQLHTQARQLPRQHQSYSISAHSFTKAPPTARLSPLVPSTLQCNLPDRGSVEWCWRWLHLALPNQVIAARPHHLKCRDQWGGQPGLHNEHTVPDRLPCNLRVTAPVRPHVVNPNTVYTP